MSQQDTIISKDKELYQHIGISIVKVLILPALLFYGNKTLNDIAETQKSISIKQDSLSDKIMNIQLGLAEQKISYVKDKELTDFRLTKVEKKYDELYEEIYSEYSNKELARRNAKRASK